eukprot:gene14894-biopygen9675
MGHIFSGRRGTGAPTWPYASAGNAARKLVSALVRHLSSTRKLAGVACCEEGTRAVPRSARNIGQPRIPYGWSSELYLNSGHVAHHHHLIVIIIIGVGGREPAHGMLFFPRE